jgi:hypothetical protein
MNDGKAKGLKSTYKIQIKPYGNTGQYAHMGQNREESHKVH